MTAPGEIVLSPDDVWRREMTGPQNDVPICPNRLVIAVESVRGKGTALALMREHLHLGPSAKLLFSDQSDCYFLQLDDHDRWQNPRVGMLDAISTMPFKTGEILRREISTWSSADISTVDDEEGLHALHELGLISPVA